MSVRERMNQDQLYTDHGEGLPEERLAGKALAYDFNMTRPTEEARRREMTEADKLTFLV
ncbi:maltose acetyltransferase domain-containing protein [Kluyvera genomosp. 1]|uniref:maltose acetyltransferase domain-containing protein n=1 Tax=Kluyvera genomosp. 1 TaxID=2774053 RepID=UPI0009E3663E|nr:maltose acetyltransferase domain-containing protein [Kluyvera genomosp. 1]